MLPRVMPGMQYWPVDVHSSPRRTMKKWVELQVATKPMRIEHQRLVGAGVGGLDAGGDAVELRMRVELLVLHVRSSRGARARCGATRPLADFSGFGVLYSGMMTMVGAPIVTRGSW